MDREEAIQRIRAALKARTGRAWSVKGRTGSAWNWICVQARRPHAINDLGYLSEADRFTLALILGKLPRHVYQHGISVSDDERERYVARFESAGCTDLPRFARQLAGAPANDVAPMAEARP